MKKTVGKNIEKLRREMGLTRVNIADFLNIDQSMISNIEKGKMSLSIDMIEKLSCLFGITIDDMENKRIEKAPYSIALRTNEITCDDMKAIYAINKIAMNVSFMTNKLKW